MFPKYFPEIDTILASNAPYASSDHSEFIGAVQSITFQWENRVSQATKMRAYVEASNKNGEFTEKGYKLFLERCDALDTLVNNYAKTINLAFGTALSVFPKHPLHPSGRC